MPRFSDSLAMLYDSQARMLFEIATKTSFRSLEKFKFFESICDLSDKIGDEPEGTTEWARQFAGASRYENFFFIH